MEHLGLRSIPDFSMAQSVPSYEWTFPSSLWGDGWEIPKHYPILYGTMGYLHISPRWISMGSPFVVWDFMNDPCD